MKGEFKGSRWFGLIIIGPIMALFVMSIGDLDNSVFVWMLIPSCVAGWFFGLHVDNNDNWSHKTGIYKGFKFLPEDEN